MIEEEEKSLMQEIRYEHCHPCKQNDSRTYKRLYLIVGIIAFLAYFAEAKADDVVLQCPNCHEYIFLNIEPPKVDCREVTGAGWYCDVCNMFSGPQAYKCTYCGASRKKK